MGNANDTLNVSRDRPIGVPQSMLLCVSHEGQVHHAEYISCVAYSPNGAHVVSSSADRHVRLRLWDAHDGRMLAQWNSADAHMHRAMVKAAAWSPDGTLLATVGFEGALKVWAMQACEREPPRLLVTLTAEAHLKQQFVPDESCHLMWFDQEFGIEENLALGLAWSPCGTKLCTGHYDMTARVWDWQQRKQECLLQGHEHAVRSVDWSNDGQFIATASFDHSVRLWTAGGHEVRKWSHQAEVVAIRFCPFGDLVCTGSFDHTLMIQWVRLNSKSPRPTVVCKGHTDFVRSVAWAPDGRKVCSGSNDNTVRLWEALTGTLLCVLGGCLDRVRHVAWSPAGSHVCAGGEDCVVRFWDVGELCKAVSHTQPQPGCMTMQA